MTFDPDQLKALAAILRRGSFEAAAAELSVTPSAISQRIKALEETTGEDGIRRCRIVFDPELIRVTPVPKRAFQGWRYLEAKDAPRDLGPVGAEGDDMPEEMRRALAEIGVM